MPEDQDKPVAPQDPTLDNSPVLRGEEADRAQASPHTFGTGAACKWNGQEYSDGGAVCSDHIRYKCWNGKWVEVGSC